ncbi:MULTISPECIES: hypothetical protein [Rhodomicrobium]|uniref:hypothetical protein n=1 Tax=Rhodomicrobium TaxID=1068 RepID=UPI000B4AC9D0|nr:MULTISPECIES: hypothetical protein [Rhodomicrobium]
MKATSETSIDYPADRIDLVGWLANLSDRDFQACSPAHRAAGAFREDGRLGTVNVESVGGHLLIQHYLAAKTAPDHVVMHSRNSRVYIMHLAPATIEVIWTLEVEPKDASSARFRCTVEARMPTLLRLVATMGLLPLFLRWHVEGETPLFAKDIARKIGGVLGPGARKAGTT